MVVKTSWRRGGYLVATLVVAALGLGCSSSSTYYDDLLPGVSGTRTYQATGVTGAGFTDATITLALTDSQVTSRAASLTHVSGRISSSDGQFDSTGLSIRALQRNRVVAGAITAAGLSYTIIIDVLNATSQCNLTLTSTAGSVTVLCDTISTGTPDAGGTDPEAQPRLALSKTSLNLPDGTDSGTVGISNTGTGTLTWTAASNVAFLAVDAASGEGDATLTITADRTGLASGTHTGQITVASNGGRLTVVVTVVVP